MELQSISGIRRGVFLRSDGPAIRSHKSLDDGRAVDIGLVVDGDASIVRQCPVIFLVLIRIGRIGDHNTCRTPIGRYPACIAQLRQSRSEIEKTLLGFQQMRHGFQRQLVAVEAHAGDGAGGDR